jgi:hypothetical protein
MHDRPGGQNPHPAELCVETDETGNVGLIVLERIYMALRGFLDEIPVEDLPAVLLVLKLLGTNLASMIQPIRSDRGQPSDRRTGQGSERRDDRGIHRAFPSLIAAPCQPAD